MKFVDKKYPCYTNTAENISESFAIKFCLSKNSTLRRNFQNARNSGEKLSLRYASVPDALNAISNKKDTGPALSTFMLRRTEALPDIGDEPDIVQIKSTLRYHLVGADYAFDATQYVYSGSLRDGFFLQQGITLDREGRLLLVKGKHKDFIKSCWQKVHGAKKFYIATVDISQYGDLRFDRLVINDKGNLIGKKKDKGDYYKIKLSTVGTPTTLAVNTGFDASFVITVSLMKLPHTVRISDELRFNINEQISVELLFKEGELYLAAPVEPHACQTNDRYQAKLRLPLSGATKILFVAKILNMVKLTVDNNGTIKIYYLNPKHVDTVNARIRHLSQKPPQNFYSGSGSDSYERVFPGQPFASRRWDKFSSRRIPLLSKTIDNFRANLRRARTFQHLGDRRRAAIAATQAVDPGVQCLAQTIAKKIRFPQRTLPPQSPPNDFTREFSEINKFINNNRMNQLFDTASAFLSVKADILTKIKYTLSLLDKNNSISLNDLFDVSFFVGIAAAGRPFLTGWFAGFMARFNWGKSLTMTKNDNGSIKFNYNKINYKTFISIFGTGQGLEDYCKLIRYNDIDFSTLLPFEANAILVVNKNAENNFSVDVPWESIDLVLDAMFKPGNPAHDIELLVRQAVKKTSNSMGATLMLEAKSELRAQVGFMADPNTFMALPRTAAGIGGAVNLFDINRQADEVTTYVSGKPEHERQVNLQHNYLSLSLFSYIESKIMPIAMVTSGDTLMCLPMPLTEELKQTLPVTRNDWARYNRLDGATLKIESDPLVSLETGNAETQQKAEPAFNLIANELKYVVSGFSKMLPKNIGDKLESLSEDIKNAVDRFHGYQTVKQGEEISTFILSKRDYKQNLRLLKQQKTAKIIISPHQAKPLRRGLKQTLRPWTKNTTLGEYLCNKKKILFAEDSLGQGQHFHAYDFIRAVEEYSSRSSRDSLGKRSGVMAIATYKIQKQVVRQIYDEFIATLNMIMSALAAGKNYDPAIERLEYLSTICSLEKAGANPIFQLDHIRLVRQNTLASRIGTVPCTILTVESRNELTYTASLGTIRFMYRNKEVFPYRLTSSLKVMPDLLF